MTPRRYCLITPCRDEERFARRTLDSVTSQTLAPALWVIVDDGSRDSTARILAEYAERFPFIRTMKRTDRGDRKLGSGVVDAFYAGYDTIDPYGFDFVCKLDLDLELPPRYFELLIERMESNPRLGSCSGKAYFLAGDDLVSERIGDDHALGMAKFYRTTCLLQIGGFVRQLAWDGIDSHRCRQLGWIAVSWDDPELRFVHLRPMGTSHRNWWTGRVRHGFGQYFMGTGPVWMLASALFRMTRPPVLVGGIAMLWGYARSAIRGDPRYARAGFRPFLRRYQRACLWKGKARALRDLDARQAAVWDPGRPPDVGERKLEGAPRPAARRRPLLKAGAWILFYLAILELGSAAILAWRPGIFRGLAMSRAQRNAAYVAGFERAIERRPGMLCVYDLELGWKPRARLDNGVDVTNAEGLRSRREYAPLPPPDTLRIAAFGDSFVYGSEVLTEEAWPSVLERLRPETEVLNYGVPGFGQDQIYLRYQAEGRKLSPAIVLFGVATPTLDRLVSVLPSFQSMETTPVGLVTKPRFLLDEAGGLTLVPNPVRRLEDLGRFVADPSAVRELGVHDYWYERRIYESWMFDHFHACRLLFSAWALADRRYFDEDRPVRGPPGGAVFNESSTAFGILARILGQFVESARASGMQPVVLLLPDGYAVERAREGKSDILEPLREHCRKAGLPTLDAGEAFRELPATADLDALFHGRFHYSAEGNRLAAQWIRREIDRQGWRQGG